MKNIIDMKKVIKISIAAIVGVVIMSISGQHLMAVKRAGGDNLAERRESKRMKVEPVIESDARKSSERSDKTEEARVELTELELYKELGALTKNKDKWGENISYVTSLLKFDSIKIKAKALWLLGEMGFKFPALIEDSVLSIASFCDSTEPLLRERAVGALGRIGRSNYHAVEPYWSGLFRFASDEEAKVRLSFIWASENIATSTPEVYESHMTIFAKLLSDKDDKVRMEAPEIFRVLGKRRPEFVKPYIERLRTISETDSNRVVRIHCLGAIKATTLK